MITRFGTFLLLTAFGTADGSPPVPGPAEARIARVKSSNVKSSTAPLLTSLTAAWRAWKEHIGPYQLYGRAARRL